jgi:hypothetical protein
MSRKTRIHLVVSLVWLLFSAYLAGWLLESSFRDVSTEETSIAYVTVGLIPIVIFWIYRFCFGPTVGWAVTALYLTWITPLVSRSIRSGHPFQPLYELLGLAPFAILALVPLGYGAYRFIKAGNPDQDSVPKG